MADSQYDVQEASTETMKCSCRITRTHDKITTQKLLTKYCERRQSSDIWERCWQNKTPFTKNLQV